jgi:hypothetical protein
VAIEHQADAEAEHGDRRRRQDERADGTQAAVKRPTTAGSRSRSAHAATTANISPPPSHTIAASTCRNSSQS